MIKSKDVYDPNTGNTGIFADEVYVAYSQPTHTFLDLTVGHCPTRIGSQSGLT